MPDATSPAPVDREPQPTPAPPRPSDDRLARIESRLDALESRLPPMASGEPGAVGLTSHATSAVPLADVGEASASLPPAPKVGDVIEEKGMALECMRSDQSEVFLRGMGYVDDVTSEAYGWQNCPVNGERVCVGRVVTVEGKRVRIKAWAKPTSENWWISVYDKLIEPTTAPPSDEHSGYRWIVEVLDSNSPGNSDSSEKDAGPKPEIAKCAGCGGEVERVNGLWQRKDDAELQRLRTEIEKLTPKLLDSQQSEIRLIEERDQLRVQIKDRSDRHWTCNGCGFSWNADPLPERDSHGHRQSPIQCKACEVNRLRAELSEIRRDVASAKELAGRGYPNIERIATGQQTYYSYPLLRDECNAMLEELGRLKAAKPCPCVHTTPCSAECSCVTQGSSRGCSRCCTYGGDGQRKIMAERLAKLIDARPAPIAGLEPGKVYVVQGGEAYEWLAHRYAKQNERFVGTDGRIALWPFCSESNSKLPILDSPIPFRQITYADCEAIAEQCFYQAECIEDAKRIIARSMGVEGR